MVSGPTGWGRTERDARSISTPRRNSRPRSLLAAGETKIFDYARVYRNGEAGPLHSSEFTMLEWYRSGEPYTAVMADCVALCRLALKEAGREAFEWRGVACDPNP
jgi:lysyl-tRNA synthetase class 2